MYNPFIGLEQAPLHRVVPELVRLESDYAPTLKRWRNAISNFHDPFWVAEQYITEKKLPSKIARQTYQSEETIIAMLQELGLWEEPHLERYSPEIRTRAEDPHRVKCFLSWFRKEHPEIAGLVYEIEQYSKNQISLSTAFYVVYSNGSKTKHSRTKHYNAYGHYINSDTWKSRAKALKKKRGGCEICGTKTGLHCHHLSYRNLGDEKDEDLRVLCKDCHKKTHRSDQ